MAHTITRVIDIHGTLQTEPVDILQTFTERIRRKHDHIPITEDSIKRIVACVLKTISPTVNAALDEPISLDELLLAVKRGKANK
jgi:hypothetical protein